MLYCGACVPRCCWFCARSSPPCRSRRSAVARRRRPSPHRPRRRRSRPSRPRSSARSCSAPASRRTRRSVSCWPAVIPRKACWSSIPPHTGTATLTFSLHNRHTYSEEEMKAGQGFAKYTAVDRRAVDDRRSAGPWRGAERVPRREGSLRSGLRRGRARRGEGRRADRQRGGQRHHSRPTSSRSACSANSWRRPPRPAANQRRPDVRWRSSATCRSNIVRLRPPESGSRAAALRLSATLHRSTCAGTR